MRRKRRYPLQKCKLRKNDKVIVVAGRSKGKTGAILRIDPVRAVAYVKDVNIVRKAVKKRSQEEQGGIIEIEAPIHISNIMLQTKSGKRSRLGIEEKDGKRVRIARKTQEQV